MYAIVMSSSSMCFIFLVGMAVVTLFIAGLVTSMVEGAAALTDEDDLFHMTNRLHGYVDDSRCDAMAEQMREAESDVKELDPKRHLAGVWVSAE